MRRRDFLIQVGAAAAAPMSAHAEKGIPAIGILSNQSPGQNSEVMAAFSQKLAELGYVEGRNLVIERRWASGDYARLGSLAEEMIGLHPAIIVVGGNVAALAAKRATSTFRSCSTSPRTR